MDSYKITGNLSLVFGVLAALSCISIPYILFGMVFAIIGFILSVFNIFINTKNGMERKLITKAHLGMVLSSVPVIYIIVVFIIFKKD